MGDVKVGILVGSPSDREIADTILKTLDSLGIAGEVKLASAHRTPDLVTVYCTTAADRGIQVLIACAGMAAHLAGAVAAQSLLPVIGVPVKGGAMDGLDALLATVQMPAGIPTATFAIGKAGSINAALFAVAILANEDAALAEKLAAFRKNQSDTVKSATLPPLD